ncbi:hypothetical protein [uncultured Clostridium sp.]|uniref:hypothetical protein n=1 Tax=uncultured Clostridium sp. TaxID=59620 RepID=UPI0025FCA7C9|nr:hypothetical protein [uncultured Clostridium sp.]
MDKLLEDLTKNMEVIRAENIKLKRENDALKELVKIQENWTGIREGYLLPILRKKYGTRCEVLYGPLLTHIGNVVKAFLGVHRFTEINESNYKEAKEIAVAFMNTFCEFEWSYLHEMEMYYKSKGMI